MLVRYGLIALLATLARNSHAQDALEFYKDRASGCKFWLPLLYSDVRVASVHWSGACGNGLATGHGIFEVVMKYGETYAYSKTRTGEGDFVAGKLTGRATIVNTGGERLEGEFRDGLPNGHGISAFDEDRYHSRFEGEFRDGRRWHGQVVTDDGWWNSLSDKPKNLVRHYVDDIEDGRAVLRVERINGCKAELRFEGEVHNDYVGSTMIAADGKIWHGTWRRLDVWYLDRQNQNRPDLEVQRDNWPTHLQEVCGR